MRKSGLTFFPIGKASIPDNHETETPARVGGTGQTLVTRLNESRTSVQPSGSERPRHSPATRKLSAAEWVGTTAAQPATRKLRRPSGSEGPKAQAGNQKAQCGQVSPERPRHSPVIKRLRATVRIGSGKIATANRLKRSHHFPIGSGVGNQSQLSDQENQCGRVGRNDRGAARQPEGSVRPRRRPGNKRFFLSKDESHTISTNTIPCNTTIPAFSHTHHINSHASTL